MPNNSKQNSRRFKIPLASIHWLYYLGIGLTVLSLYVVADFFYLHGNDVFPKSLSVAQYFKLALYSIGSMLSELFIPVLFFSGALVYRSIRLRGINPVIAIKRDQIIILPIGIIIWIYGAYLEEPVERKFYSMVFDIQCLRSGEKLTSDSKTYELIDGHDLSGLQGKIDSLAVQINNFENQFIDNDSPANESYISELQKQQLKYQDEVLVIHFKPFYVLLFMILGLLLGYLIPIHNVALTIVLIAIGLAWLYVMRVLELSLNYQGYSGKHVQILVKIGILLVLNSILLNLADKTFKRSRENLL